MPLAPQARVGPYEILDRIGSGGMGEVWKARDTRLGRVVAIKQLKDQFNERFEREARAVAALNHPNICVLYDVGPDYLVMEYIEGVPLRGGLPAAEAVRIAMQVADALEAAHSKGIVHRDLKPGNILIGKSGVKLLDFGLAKVEAAATGEETLTQTHAGTVLGTAAYMSPEQAQGKPVDARSDIFSFGAVLYEMLSGRRAFHEDTMLSTLAAIVRDEPPPLEAPDDLTRIVTRCMRKSLEARYQTMTELKAALAKAVHTEGVSQPSIAVLPFANMSRDADDEYFSDGLAEEIINLLAHVPGLKVTARTSAFAFRGKEQDITKIAEALKVRAILQGSVRRAGNRIRVTAQLINAQDGYHLWSERYDRELTDIFAVQDEIAAAIAQALQVKLSPKPTALQRHAPSLPAYEAYLKGRHYQWRALPDDVDKSKQFYLQAVELDPQFPLAYIGYGDHFLYSAASGLQPAREAMPIVRENARKALELDPALPEAHAMLGIVAAHLDHDWQEAGRHFQRAVAHEPVPPLVRSWYGFFYLGPSGRPQGSIEQHERALQEDPLNVLYRSCLASALMLAGRPAEAERQARQVLDVDPTFQIALFIVGPACMAQGKTGYALAFGEKAHDLYPVMTWPTGLLAAVHDRMGDPGRAAPLLESIRSGSEYGAPVGFAIYHACRGEIDQAVAYVIKAVEFGQPCPWNFLGLSLETMRSSSNWPRLAKAANLPHDASQ